MKNKLVQLLILAGLSLHAKNNEISGLVRHYPLNNDLKDYSNSALDLQGIGAFGFGRFCDKKGAGAFFTQTNAALIPLGTDATSITTQNYSYSVWVRIQSTTNGKRSIMAVGNGTTEQHLYIYNGFGLSSSFDNTNLSATSSTQPIVNQWYHIVGVKRSDSLLIFVNGIKEQKVALPANHVTQYGAFNTKAYLTSNSNSRNFEGLLDEIKIFNRGISDQEVLSLYNADKSTLCNNNPPITEPIRYFAFNNNSKDSSASNTTLSYTPNFVRDRFCNPEYAIYSASNASAPPLISMTSEDGSSALSQDYTYSMWVKPAIPPASLNQTCVFSFGGLNGDQSLGFTTDGFFASSYYKTTAVSSTTITGQTIPKTQTWYHISSVKLQDTLFLYVNGVLEKKSTLPQNQKTHYTGTSMALGRRMAGGMLSFEGMIDELRVYQRGLNAKEIQQLYNTKPYVPCNISNDIHVRDYRFSNLKDSSTYKSDLVISQIIPKTGHNCDINGATFNSIGYGLDPEDELFSPEYTYSAWIKPTSLPTITSEKRNILAIGGKDGEQILMQVPGAFKANNGNTGTTTTTTPQIETWYHLVSVKTSDSLYLYVNGILENAIVNNVTANYGNTRQPIIGGNTVNGAKAFDGEISDVKIYNVSLRPSNVAKLYNDTKPSSSCISGFQDDKQINEASVQIKIGEDQTLLISSEYRILDIKLSNLSGQTQSYGTQQEIKTQQTGLIIVVIHTENGVVSKKILIP